MTFTDEKRNAPTRDVPILVIHVPHSSTVIPADGTLDRLRISEEELAEELLRMTDWFTDELFSYSKVNATPVIFGLSRLAVDPERFPDDDQEPMAKIGMGAIYTHTSKLQNLREPLGDRDSVLRRYYLPHHHRLESAVDRALQAHGCCLIIDGHSFPRDPLPYELDQNLDRAQICLGTDPFHTPGWLRDAALRSVKRAGWSVAVDRPFSGAIVPLSHYRTTRSVWAIMIEVRRDLYMVESDGAKSDGFEGTRTRIQAILADLEDEARNRQCELTARQGP
jgi:N-formylglutamate deformylase